MNHLDCACPLSCPCQCNLIKAISYLLDASRAIGKKREILCDFIDDDFEGFDGALDDIAYVIGTLLEIKPDSHDGDKLFELIFGYTFGHSFDAKEDVIKEILAI